MRSGEYSFVMNNRFWNVTYNDPGRWRDVYAISGPRLSWGEGFAATLKGHPLGSPKLELAGIDGLTELQNLRAELNDRTHVNFLRTKGGLIAFTKVRLEVYAIPIRNSEWRIERITDTNYGEQLVMHIQRDGVTMRLMMAGATSTLSRMQIWLERADR